MRSTVARHDGELGRWETVTRQPHPRLGAAVRRYTGYEERTPEPLRRTEAPRPEIAVIVSLGPPIDVAAPGDTPRRQTSFVVGLHDRHATTEHAGFQRGIQINLSPLVAGALLRVPMHELANRTVPLEDVLGRSAGELTERLNEAPGWHARFRLLDDLIARRLAAAAGARPASLEYAWARLHSSHGAVPIGTLARELGCSRRLLELQFRDHLGMAPKMLARLLRFGRARDLLERDDGARFAEIATRCGYYDQAHLNRDFRAFAGVAPREFLARRLPDGGGVAADEFASVQDRQEVAA
jgi:AraC-like DNA-binding protein